MGDTVYIRNYSGKHKWLPGRIQRRVGKVMYEIDINGVLYSRHIDQIFLRHEKKNAGNDYMDSKFADNAEKVNPGELRKEYPQRERKPPVRYGHHE